MSDNKYKKIFKILIIGGMAPIPMEIFADEYRVEDLHYSFIYDSKEIGCYPINSTIIKSFIDNPSYVEPPIDYDEIEQRERINRIHMDRLQMLRNRNRFGV